MLHQLFTLPFNVNHASSKKNTSTVSRSPLSINSWNYCNNCLLLFSIQEDTNMILHQYNFKNFVVLWAEYFDAPMSTVKWCKNFLWIFLFEHHYQPISCNLKPKNHTFSSWPTKSLLFKILPLFCTPFFYTAHFFSKTLVTLLRLHMWIKHILPDIQGVKLHCNTRQQCYKNIGFLQYSTWVTGSQRPPIPMLAVSTLSLNTEHCASKLWSSYSLSNPRHHTNNLKFYICYCKSSVFPNFCIHFFFQITHH
jgi:hypothetical protein